MAQYYWLVYRLSPDTFERNLNQPLDVFGNEATCSNELPVVKIFEAQSSRPNPVSTALSGKWDENDLTAEVISNFDSESN